MPAFHKRCFLALALVAATDLLVQAPMVHATTSCADSLQWTSRGTKSPNRWHHTAIWDADSERVVIFGGQNTSTTYNDVIAYKPKTNHWDTLSTSGPARAYHTAIYDPVGKRMLVYGGATGQGTDYLYSFSLISHTWSQPTTSGTSPGYRVKHLAVYNSSDSSMIVFGGTAEGTGGHQTKKLKLSTMTWSSLPSFYTARYGAAGIYDPVGHRLVLFGGGDVIYSTGCSVIARADVWSLNLTGTPAWTQLAGSSSMAEAAGATAFYEPQCHRMIVYGGVYDFCGGATPFDQLQSFDLGTDTWSNSRGYVNQPPARGYHSLAYDPYKRFAYVFGGGGIASNDTTVLNDQWRLNVTDLTPPSAITNLAVTNCTSSSLDLSWSAPIDDNGATVTAYDVRAYSEPIDESNWDSATPLDGIPQIPGAPGTTESMTVTNLTGCTWYYFAVKSVDNVMNVSGLSNGASGRTKCSGSQVCMTGGVSLRHEPTPRPSAVFALSQPVPNPARSEIAVEFSLAATMKGPAELGVYDLVGRRITTLYQGASEAGRHTARWNLLDASGHRVAGGIYWIRLISNGEVKTRSVVVR